MKCTDSKMDVRIAFKSLPKKSLPPPFFLRGEKGRLEFSLYRKFDFTRTKKKMVYKYVIIVTDRFCLGVNGFKE